MAALTRLTGTNCFADNVDNPALIVRPSVPGTTARWTPDETNVGDAVFAIVRRDQSLSDRKRTISWLEAEIVKGGLANRVAFLDSPGNVPLCALLGYPDGSLTNQGSVIRFGEYYRIDTASGSIGYDSSGYLSIIADDDESDPHVFVHEESGVEHRIGVDALSIGLFGTSAGLVFVEGSVVAPGQAQSSLDLYVGMGLVTRFTEYLMGTVDPEHCVEQSALLNGGYDFTFVAGFNARIDPLVPYDESRSFFRLEPLVGDTLELTLPLPPGQVLSVRPVVGWEDESAPRFILTRTKTAGVGSASGWTDTLSVIGTYEVLFEGADYVDAANLGLIPGFTPSEVLLAARNDDKLLIDFQLGPADDPRLKPKIPDGSFTDDPSRLNLEAIGGEVRAGLTPWIRLQRPDRKYPMVMSAESPTARRLSVAKRRKQSRERVAGRAREALPTVYTHSPLLRKTDVASPQTGFLPALPARGVPSVYRQAAARFDREFLARERQKLTSLSYQAFRSGRKISATGLPGTTPLGFEIEQNPSGAITRVIFARYKDPEGGIEAEFSISGSDDPDAPLNSEFIDAIVRNKLFLVANRIPKTAFGLPLGNFKLNSKIIIGGWTFDVSLPDPSYFHADSTTSFNTFLIIKNITDKSIVELVNDPAAWAAKGSFIGPLHGDAAGASAESYLQAFVRNVECLKITGKPCSWAVAEPGEPADKVRYGKLYDEILSRRDWQGVLVVDASLGLGALPLQIKGLLGGMDTSRLKANYIALPMKRMAGGEVPLKSRLSGLVDYDARKEGPASPNPVDGDGDPADYQAFGYDVTRLTVDFSGGEIEAFGATVRLAIGKLFHAGGKLWVVEHSRPTRTADFLAFSGRYRRRREGNQNIETYTFETVEDYRFVTDVSGGTPLIEYVDVKRAAYETLEANGNNVQSAFRLDGSIKFGKTGLLGAVGDIIDLDSLDFFDLRIASSFTLIKIGDLIKIGALKMAFRVGALGFDFGSASARSDGTKGFLSSFPLKFRKFWMFDSDLNLGNLGYFSFNGFDGQLKLRFGFDFDLDLGTLGALTSFKGLKFGVLLAFPDGGSLVNGSVPRFALGYRFPEGDGSLDLGIQGFLKLKADKWGILDSSFPKPSGEVANAKLIYAQTARLEILGEDFPDQKGISLVVFVDPSAISGGLTKGAVGWFAARKTDGASGDIAGGAVHLDLLAVGQRVDPLFGVDPKTTKQFIDYIVEVFGHEPFDKDAGDAPDEMAKQVAIALSPAKPKITFAPDRGWSVGFRALFAKWVEIGFAMRDPDIYGLRVGLLTAPGSKDYLFAIDALYRKLSERLGVYSVEIVPPKSLRQLDFGVVTVDVPSIGIEIFTDGGFTVDLGYPWNLDFARAFGVQVFPFIGSGGLYYRQVSGPAAKLLPAGVKYYKEGDGVLLPPNDDIYCYDPVIEAGLAFRVGLGKEIDKGIFRAGLSLTVFATMEGGFGVLKQGKDYDPAYRTGAAHTFISVRGTVGILGEIYGYVDFGIVKAGISVRIWVAFGLHFRTDYRTRLYIQGGVSVRVKVVIGSFKVLGHKIEISISFSFSTTVEYSTYIGRDGQVQYYDWSLPSSSKPMLMATSGNMLPEIMPGDGRHFDWSTKLAPSEWRTYAAKLGFDLYCVPDVTMTQRGTAMAPEAVLMLSALVSEEQKVDADELPALVSAWAIKAYFGAPSTGTIRDWQVTAGALDAFANRFSNGPTLNPFAAPRSGSERKGELPVASDVSVLFGDNLELTLGDAEAAGAPIPGVFIPLPPGSQLARYGFKTDTDYDMVDFDAKQVVDDSYRDDVDAAFQKLMALVQQSDAPMKAMAVSKVSIVNTVFEEYAALLMRATLVQLARLADEELREKEPFATVSLGSLLDRLSTFAQKSSKSRDILLTATRMFLYGPRLPFPQGSKTPDIPPGVTDENAHYGLYQLGWMQVPLGPGADVESRKIKVTLNQPYIYGDAVTIPVSDADTDTFAQLGDPVVTLGGTIKLADAFRERPRHFHAGRVNPVSGSQGLLMLDPEVCSILNDDAQPEIPELLISKSEPPIIEDGQLETPDWPTSSIMIDYAAIAVTIRLKPMLAQVTNSPRKDLFELIGMSEQSRVRLDRYEEGQNVDTDVAAIRLFQIGKSALTELHISAANDATVVQSDLSAEPKPATAAIRSRSPSSVASTYVATPDDKAGFLEIVRRTGIVNRGGTTIGWAGASDELKETIDGKSGAFDVLLVLQLKPGAGGHANSVMVTDADLFKQGLEATFKNADKIQGATVIEPTAEAGVMPLLVERPPSSSPVADQQDAWNQLKSRFSMFAWTATDKRGSVLAQAEKNLCSGPNRDDEDDVLRIELPVPLFKLFGQAYGDTSPYDRVGEKLRISGIWRDVFGNDWSKPIDEQTFPIQYVDRLIPITDLPGLAFGWWPGSVAGLAVLEFALDRRMALGLVPAGNESADIGAEELSSISNVLERASTNWIRARQQIYDGKVTLTVKPQSTSHPQWQNDVALDGTQKQTIVDFLDRAVQCLAKMRAEGTIVRSALRAAFASLIDGVAACDIRVIGKLSDEDFVELALALETRRPPKRAAGSPAEIIVSVVPVPMPVRDEGIEINPPFGGTLAELAGVCRAFAPQSTLATGLPSEPGPGDRAYWLVRNDVLPAEDRFKNALKAPLHFALPPLSTHLHAFPNLDVPVLTSGGEGSEMKSFRAIDADEMAARAFDAYEQILSPGMVSRLERTDPGREALQSILSAKAKLAESLGDRLTPVFDDQPDDEKRLELAKRAVTDRILASLRFVDAVDTIIVLPERDSATVGPGPVAYGSLELGASDGLAAMQTEPPPISMSPYVMPVGPDRSHDLVLTVDASPSFTELYYSDTFRYSISHVQRLDRLENVPAGSVGRYRPTAWLAFVNPIVYQPAKIEIPVLKRRYPIPVELKSEELVLPASSAKVGPTLRYWGSSRQWTSEGLASDKLEVTLRYNPMISELGSGDSPSAEETERAKALTIFVASVVPQLQSFNFDSEDEVPDPLVKFLGDRCIELVAAMPLRSRRHHASAADITDIYDIREDPEKKTITIQRTAPGVEGLTDAIMSVMDKTGSVELATSGPITVGTATTWHANQSTDGGLQRRRLTMAGADILSLRAVQTELALTRNSDILGRAVRSKLVYRLPIVASGAALVPAITLQKVDISPARPKSITDIIVDLVAGLLQNPPSDEILEQLALDIVLGYEPFLAAGAELEGEDLTVAAMSKVGLAGNQKTWLEPFTNQAEEWLDAHRPPPLGLFVFDVRLFERRPITSDNAPESDRLIIRIGRAVVQRHLVAHP